MKQDDHGRPPIADALVDADADAVERVWHRLTTGERRRPTTLSGYIGRWAAVAVAVAVAYGAVRLLAQDAPPAHGSTAVESTPSAGAHDAPTAAPGLPAGHARRPSSPVRTPAAPKATANPSDDPPAPAERTAAAAPRRTSATARQREAVAPPERTRPDTAPADVEASPTLSERSGAAVAVTASASERPIEPDPDPSDDDALLDEVIALTGESPDAARALLDAGLAAGLPPTAALHVVLSDAWAARGDHARAARAARRALRAAPVGPHATRMRSRTVPRNPPR